MTNKLIYGSVVAGFIGINWMIYKTWGPKVSIIYLPATLGAATLLLMPDPLAATA